MDLRANRCRVSLAKINFSTEMSQHPLRGVTFGNEQSHVILGLTRACVGRQLS